MTTIARCKGFGTIFAVVLFFAALPAFTANDTWTGAVNGDFSNASNWSGGNVPGNTSSGATVNTDIATFTTNVVNNIVNIDSGRSVARFFFGASELPYVFNGGPLYVFSHTNVNHNANATFRFMPGSLANKSVTFNVPIIGASTGSASNRNIYFTGLGGNANIALGVMYNVNGNLTTGNISGGGSVIFDNGAVAVVRGSINNPAGTANSSVSLDFTGPAVWFKNNDNPFRGSLGLTRGIALFETVTQVAGGNSALGNPANATLGNITMSSTTGGAMLYYVGRDAAGHSSDRNIFTANDSRYLAILSSSGVGNLTWTGNVRPVAPSTSNYSFLYLAGHNTGENVFSGVMSDTTNGSFTLALGLRKRGEGTWNLTAANLNTSTNWLNAGLLRLDFAAAGAPVNNILNSVSPMMLNSGVLALRGKVATANTQTVNGTILREGSTSIEMTPGSNGGTVTLNLGALTRNSSIGTTMTGHVLNISNPSGTTATTTHTGTTNGVLTINETAFATVNKTDWAALSSGNIVALSSYQTSTDPAGWSASDNVSLAVNPDTNIGAGVVINTLRLTGSSALTLDGNFSVGASGILITGGTANISGGNLIGGGNQTERELIIIQNSPNTATISSLIRNGTLSGNMHLTKAGSGRLDLTGNHSGVSGRYLETTVAAGILAVPNRNALGNSTLKFAGGQVGLTNSDITFRAATGNNATQVPYQIVASLGFTAYGGTRTAFQATDMTLGSSLPGEFMLSSPDATGKIVIASATSNTINIASGSRSPHMTAIRVFDGTEAVDAEIAMPMTVLHNASATGIGGIHKLGPGVLQLSAANTYNGATIVAEGGLLVTGSIANSMLTEVRSGAWLGGTGMISSLEIYPGAKLAPGMSIGTLSTQDNGNGYFLWNGEASGSEPGQLQFELSTTDNTSDLLNLGTSEFLKGTGSVFKFDFMGGGKAGEAYTLVQFGSTTFTDASEFSYENLGSGLSGSFTLNSNDLVFTVIPEPGTVGMVLAGLALMALRRCRMRG